MGTETLRLDIDDRDVATLTADGPEPLNALAADTLGAIADALAEAAEAGVVGEVVPTAEFE